MKIPHPKYEGCLVTRKGQIGHVPVARRFSIDISLKHFRGYDKRGCDAVGLPHNKLTNYSNGHWL